MVKKIKSNKKRGGATLNPLIPSSLIPKSFKQPFPTTTIPIPKSFNPQPKLLKSFIPPFPTPTIPKPFNPQSFPKQTVTPQTSVPVTKKNENIIIWFIKLIIKIIFYIIFIIIIILFVVCLIGFIFALVGGYIFIDSIFKGITYAIKYTINPLLKVFKIKKIKTPKSFYELMKMFIYMAIKNNT